MRNENEKRKYQTPSIFIKEISFEVITSVSVEESGDDGNVWGPIT